jgi:hypothetical protein
MDFREWLHIAEMAHVRVPPNLELTTPCLKGKVLNSGSNFVFKTPQGELYCVVQQGVMLPDYINREQATELVRKQGFTLIPDGWWQRAQAIDPEGNVIATQPVG